MRKVSLLLLLLLLPAYGLGEKIPPGWKKLGQVEGLLGDDWYQKKTSNTVSFARQGDLAYVDEVVKGLEASYQVNRDLLGLTPPRLPLEFYFCPITEPGHKQPKFRSQLQFHTRASGVALSGTKMCVVNLGSQRTGEFATPWQLGETSRHEMNHLFAFSVRGQDRLDSWGWLYEALAEYVENSARPPSAQLDLAGIKSFMKGYRAVDADWGRLVSERNHDELEQYRDYEKLLASIVFFMRERYGKDSVARLMKAARGRDLEDAFTATFGVGARGLEQEWKKFYSIK